MKRIILISILFIATLMSCVSPRIYKDLEARHEALKKENKTLAEENDELLAHKNQLEKDLNALQNTYDDTLASRDKLQNAYNACKLIMKI